MSKKERPVRVYWDAKAHKFYLLKTNKETKKREKAYLNLPAEIRSLAAAQKYVNDAKLMAVYEPKEYKIPIGVNIDVRAGEKPLYKRYKEFREENKPLPVNLTPEEVEQLRKNYEEEKYRSEQLAASQLAANILQRDQEAKDRINELEEKRVRLAIENVRRDAEDYKREALIGPSSTTSTPAVPRASDEKEIDIGPIIVEGPEGPAPGYNIHRLPASNELRRQEARRNDFELKVIKDKDLEKKNINFGDFLQFELWNGPKSDDVWTTRYFDVAKYLVDPSNKNEVKSNFPPGGDFNIQSGDHTEERTKRILRALTPQKYNELVNDGRLPTSKFSVIPNPDRLQSGSGDFDPKFTGELPALYNDQIEEFFEGDPKFGGVISSDQIHILPDKLPMGFIINLDKASEPGSHWCACYMDGQSVEYFDPMGDPPTDDFVKRMKKKIKNMKIPIMMKFKINRIQQQHGSSHKCGYHSMRFLDDRMNGIPFPMASRFHPDKKINNSKRGEQIIKEEFELI
jgi:hypothetical protein